MPGKDNVVVEPPCMAALRDSLISIIHDLTIHQINWHLFGSVISKKYMKNILLLITIAVLTSSALKAQTVKENIEKISRNPKTAEHAGKADAKIQDKKVIVYPPGQSSTISNNKGSIPTSGRKKRQNCKPIK